MVGATAVAIMLMPTQQRIINHYAAVAMRKKQGGGRGRRRRGESDERWMIIVMMMATIAMSGEEGDGDGDGDGRDDDGGDQGEGEEEARRSWRSGRRRRLRRRAVVGEEPMNVGVSAKVAAEGEGSMDGPGPHGPGRPDGLLGMWRCLLWRGPYGRTCHMLVGLPPT